jgi:hypothetical protein
MDEGKSRLPAPASLLAKQIQTIRRAEDTAKRTRLRGTELRVPVIAQEAFPCCAVPPTVFVTSRTSCCCKFAPLLNRGTIGKWGLRKLVHTRHQ